MWPRGNVRKEREEIENCSIDIVLKGVTLSKLKRTFDRIGDYPKPSPNHAGRPRLTTRQKVSRKRNRHGQLELFRNL